MFFILNAKIKLGTNSQFILGCDNMIFRRQEGFRYTFNSPLPCEIKIIKIDETPISTDFGSAQILDLSPNGMKIISPLNVFSANKKVEIEINFSFEDYFFQIQGRVMWQHKVFQNGQYCYGVHIIQKNNVTSEKIINLLKAHTKNAALHADKTHQNAIHFTTTKKH